jgi:hypothetical protein
MARLLSSDVSNATPITADSLERLWVDIWEHHQHSSDEGGTGVVDHANVIDDDGVHTMLDTHALIGGSFVDNPGGSKGVHGLGTDGAVIGTTEGQYLIQWGTTAQTDNYDDDRLENRGKAVFPVPFSEPPVVCFAAPIENTYDVTSMVTVYKTTRNSMSVKFKTTWMTDERNVLFCWIAIGRI